MSVCRVRGAVRSSVLLANEILLSRLTCSASPARRCGGPLLVCTRSRACRLKFRLLVLLASYSGHRVAVRGLLSPVAPFTAILTLIGPVRHSTSGWCWVFILNQAAISWGSKKHTAAQEVLRHARSHDERASLPPTVCCLSCGYHGTLVPRWLRGGVVRNCVITYSTAQYVQGDTSCPCVCPRCGCPLCS